jgi:hypothetical protein
MHLQQPPASFPCFDEPCTLKHLAGRLHTNRALQELRGEGLITFDPGKLTILDWEGLVEAGEFDPA